MIDNKISKLYSGFDDLYKGIGEVCATCYDHDCEGYVWLLKQEADSLYNQGIPIIEVNNRICFIHSFKKKRRKILVNQLRPKCKLRKRGGCTIYSNRPLVCRMYPVGLLTSGKDIVLALHNDCKFSRELLGSNRARFIRKALLILQNAPKDLLWLIYETYLEVDLISALPEGPNSYEIITPFRNILGKGG